MTKKVLIVGAGIAGCSLAKILLDKGVHCDVVEKDGECAQGGFVINLWPHALEILNQIGAYPGRKEVVENLCLRDTNLKRVSGLGLAKIVFRGVSGGLYLRSEVIGSLRKSIHGKIVYNTVVDGHKRVQRGHEIELSNGETRFYDDVVYCKGTHTFLNKTPSHKGWRASIWRLSGSHKVGNVEYVSVYKENWCFFPMFDEVYAAQFVHPSKKESDISSLTNSLHSLGLNRKFLESLSSEPPVWTGTLSFFFNKKWKGTKGEYYLGDAVHTFSPLTGFGGSMALEDAVLFSQFLLGEISWSDFVQQRNKRLWWVKKYTQLMDCIILSQNRVLMKMRNAIFPKISAKVPEKMTQSLINKVPLLDIK